MGLFPAMVSWWPPTHRLSCPQTPSLPALPHSNHNPTPNSVGHAGHIQCVAAGAAVIDGRNWVTVRNPPCRRVRSQHENWVCWPLIVLAEKLLACYGVFTERLRKAISAASSIMLKFFSFSLGPHHIKKEPFMWSWKDTFLYNTMRVAEVADKFLEGPKQYPWKTLVEGILATLGSGWVTCIPQCCIFISLSNSYCTQKKSRPHNDRALMLIYRIASKLVCKQAAFAKLLSLAAAAEVVPPQESDFYRKHVCLCRQS